VASRGETDLLKVQGVKKEKIVLCSAYNTEAMSVKRGSHFLEKAGKDVIHPQEA